LTFREKGSTKRTYILNRFSKYRSEKKINKNFENLENA